MFQDSEKILHLSCYVYYIWIFHLCRQHGKSIMGVTAPNVPENNIEDFANAISILVGNALDFCQFFYVWHWLSHIGHLTLTVSHWTFDIDCLQLDIWHWLSHFGQWTLTLSHLLLSFPRSTLGQSELQCLHRIDRRYGILWGEDICFGQLQILFLVSEPSSRNPNKNLGEIQIKIMNKF